MDYWTEKGQLMVKIPRLSKTSIILLAVNLFFILMIIYFLILSDKKALPDSSYIDYTSIENTSLYETSVSIEVNFNALLENAIFHKTRKKFIDQRAERRRAQQRERQQQQEQERRIQTQANLFNLKGIVFDQNGDSIVLLDLGNNEKEHRVKLNQQVEGWTVKEIFKNSIIIERGGQQKVLNLIKK